MPNRQPITNDQYEALMMVAREYHNSFASQLTAAGRDAIAEVAWQAYNNRPNRVDIGVSLDDGSDELNNAE